MTNSGVAPLPGAARVMGLARASRISESGEGLRRRVATGIGLRAMADAAGTSVTSIWRWENGRCTPTGDAAIRWVDIIDQLGDMVTAAPPNGPAPPGPMAVASALRSHHSERQDGQTPVPTLAEPVGGDAA